MAGSELQYSLPTAPHRRRLPWRRVFVGVAGLALLAMALVFPAYQVESRVDPVTGTTTRRTTWFFGPSITSRSVTRLEVALKARGVSWNSTSRFLGNTHYTLIGRPTLFECGQAPLIYAYREILDEHARAATTGELQSLVQVLQSGTDAQQKAALDAIADPVLDGPATSPSSR